MLELLSAPRLGVPLKTPRGLRRSTSGRSRSWSGGVSSPVRAFKAVGGGTPRFMAKGRGSADLGRRRQRVHRLRPARGGP